MSWQIIQADARQIPLKDGSVQCVVTSPPYWGLRDYGTATWVGGDEGCDHVQRIMRPSSKSTLEDHGDNGRSPYLDSLAGIPFRDSCPKCGATRIDSQIGLEATPEEYVAKIVAVFSEVWRVLRDDGTCWVNLGDSYASNPASGGKSTSDKFCPNIRETQQTANGMRRAAGLVDDHKTPQAQYKRPDGLKPKDLVGIPWRVAFALQAAGWYLRSDIIWSKPNPMPESVTDRPTKAHEYIFLFSKKERYFFDQDAVREEHTSPMIARNRWQNGGGSKESMSGDPTQNYGSMEYNPAGRNIRTVWEIATQPYPEAHFATFPEEIAVRCIKAGTSEKGACKECGAPWERVIERTGGPPNNRFRDGLGGDCKTAHDHGTVAGSALSRLYAEYGYPQLKTIGWQPTCPCLPVSVSPCLVLDPFSGAGTVALVADKLNRRGIGLEIKAEYCRMAKHRCYDDAPLFSGLTLTPD